MLSMNDLEIWNRVLDEQTEGINRYGNKIKLEALEGMRLLHEHPPLILLTRKVQQDVELKGKRPFPKSRHAKDHRWFGLGVGSHRCRGQQFA